MKFRTIDLNSNLILLLLHNFIQGLTETSRIVAVVIFLMWRLLLHAVEMTRLKPYVTGNVQGMYSISRS